MKENYEDNFRGRSDWAKARADDQHLRDQIETDFEQKIKDLKEGRVKSDKYLEDEGSTFNNEEHAKLMASENNKAFGMLQDMKFKLTEQRQKSQFKEKQIKILRKLTGKEITDNYEFEKVEKNLSPEELREYTIRIQDSEELDKEKLEPEKEIKKNSKENLKNKTPEELEEITERLEKEAQDKIDDKEFEESEDNAEYQL